MPKTNKSFFEDIPTESLQIYSDAYERLARVLNAEIAQHQDEKDYVAVLYVERDDIVNFYTAVVTELEKRGVTVKKVFGTFNDIPVKE